MPPAVSAYVVNHYVRLRQVQKLQEEEQKTHTYTSARTLLGVLRLAQALARLRFSEEVSQGDVDEALRLMAKSKDSLNEDDDQEGRDADQTVESKIYRIIRDMASSGGAGRGRRIGRGPARERDMDLDDDEEEEDLSMVDIRARILAKGFTEDQLMSTIQEVSSLNTSSMFTNDFIVVRGHSRLHQNRKRNQAAVHDYIRIVHLGNNVPLRISNSAIFVVTFVSVWLIYRGSASLASSTALVQYIDWDPDYTEVNVTSISAKLPST